MFTLEAIESVAIDSSAGAWGCGGDCGGELHAGTV